MKPHGGQPVVTVGTPLGESHAAMIMVHGRNAAPKNILDLVALLNQPSFTYLAPAAADNSWYPYSFMAETEQNEPGITSGLQVLDALVRDLVTRGIRKQRVVLLGFSQGACLAARGSLRGRHRVQWRLDRPAGHSLEVRRLVRRDARVLRVQ
jgi:predicted esterase